MSTLPSAITNLSIAGKFELLDALWQDIESHAPVLTDEQSAELDRRMANYEQDPSTVIPREQVKADLLKQRSTNVLLKGTASAVPLAALLPAGFSRCGTPLHVRPKPVPHSSRPCLTR